MGLDGMQVRVAKQRCWCSTGAYICSYVYEQMGRYASAPKPLQSQSDGIGLNVAFPVLIQVPGLAALSLVPTHLSVGGACY